MAENWGGGLLEAISNAYSQGFQPAQEANRKSRYEAFMQALAQQNWESQQALAQSQLTESQRSHMADEDYQRRNLEETKSWRQAQEGEWGEERAWRGQESEKTRDWQVRLAQIESALGIQRDVKQAELGKWQDSGTQGFYPGLWSAVGQAYKTNLENRILQKGETSPTPEESLDQIMRLYNLLKFHNIPLSDQVTPIQPGTTQHYNFSAPSGLENMSMEELLKLRNANK